MHKYISSPGNTADILKRNSIILKKSLGQNFLIDTNILKKIVRVSGVGPEDKVLEIGSGIGSLTEIIAPEVKKVVCIEIDKKLSLAFQENFGYLCRSSYKENITLIENDAMRMDYRKLTEEHNISTVISNLPYKIAAPLILKILIEAPGIKKMYLTIQKDIAERLLAKPGDKDYSSYCVKANFFADFKIMFQVPRNCFMPIPNIDSTVIEVSVKDSCIILINKNNIGEFFYFIDSCFLHRRKKLTNSLQASLRQSVLQQDNIDKKDLIVKMLHGIGKEADIRAEDLTIQEFITLFLSIYRTSEKPEKK